MKKSLRDRLKPPRGTKTCECCGSVLCVVCGEPLVRVWRGLQFNCYCQASADAREKARARSGDEWADGSFWIHGEEE